MTREAPFSARLRQIAAPIPEGESQIVCETGERH